MKNKISWKQKYLIAISEYCSTKDIQNLLEVSISKAREIKRNVEIECMNNNIKIYCSNKVPTDVLLDLIEKDTKYFYNKMIAEAKAV